MIQITLFSQHQIFDPAFLGIVTAHGGTIEEHKTYLVLFFGFPLLSSRGDSGKLHAKPPRTQKQG